MDYLKEFKSANIVVHIRNADQKNKFMLYMESIGFHEESMDDGEQLAVITREEGLGITCYSINTSMYDNHREIIMFEEFMENTKGGNNMNKNNKSEPIYTKKMIENMGIETILFNDEATVVVLTDGRKGVSVVDSTDDPDRLVGIAVAYAYAVGTNGSKTQFKKNMVKINKHNGYK